MNNSVFGKTMENLRNRSNINLITDIPDLEDMNEEESYKGMSSEKKLKRRVCNPNLQHVTIFNENMVAVQQFKNVVKMDKPVFCGQSILDISKVLMYDFHYDTMLKKYGYEKCKWLFTE